LIFAVLPRRLNASNPYDEEQVHSLVLGDAFFAFSAFLIKRLEQTVIKKNNSEMIDASSSVMISEEINVQWYVGP